MPAEEFPEQLNLNPEPAVVDQSHFSLKHFWEYMRLILIGLVLYTTINLLVARIKVESISMEPTLEPGDFLAVFRLAYQKELPETGEIVVFRYPLDPDVQYIKRVIGTPGDSIFISNGSVFVNGTALTEAYLSSAPIYTYQIEKIPEGYLFVLGDNRNRSADSHVWGLVPVKNLVGKALFVYWPADRIQSFLENPLAADS